MIKNLIQIAFRNIRRNLMYSTINILGLAVGIASCMLIISFVTHELSYDQYHSKKDRIYRMYMDGVFGTQEIKMYVTPNILAPTLQREFPEVEESARAYNIGYFSPRIVQIDDNIYQERGFYYADSSLFRIFDYKVIHGDLATALDEPNQVVLTESVSRKYFGDRNPVGETFLINNNTDYLVTAVIEDIPDNSHLRFDLAGSFSSINQGKPENLQWGSANYSTYVLLREDAHIRNLQEKITNYVNQATGEQMSQSGLMIEYKLQPLSDIHLNPELGSDLGGGDIRYVYIFSSIALLVLLIACINYMNLATARSSERAREVGMRKMMGAGKSGLFYQFIGESALTTFFSMVIAIILVEFSMPLFNNLTGKSLGIQYFNNPGVITGLFIFWVIVSFLAGSYPALVLANFKPSSVLKGSFKSSAFGSMLRKVLVIFQFGITIFLMIGTAVIFKQLSFIQQKKLGYDNEQVVYLPLDRSIINQLDRFKTELTASPDISMVTAASETPTNVKGGYSFTVEGGVPGDVQETVAMSVDVDIVKAMDMEIVAGRDYTEADLKAESYRFIINEATARARNWSVEEAILKNINLNGRQGHIVGVVQDFHFSSMHQEIHPIVFFIYPNQYNYLMVKLSGDVSEGISFMESKWKELAPHRPFEYDFLDQEYASLYTSEQKLAQLFSIFSVLAIVIAAMGLFGLASYTAVQRSKEISVRKVMGASVSGVIGLLSRDFSRLVLIAFIITAPIAYIIMDKWLQDFAYKTAVGWETIIISGMIAFIVASLTVAYHAYRAATTNPVDVLRYE